MAAKYRKYSMRYWVKHLYGMGSEMEQAFLDAIQIFVDSGEHPSIVFDGEPIAFANALFEELMRKRRILWGEHFTPLDIAETMAGSIGAGPLVRVLDPSAGVGNLLWAARQRGSEGYGYELKSHLARAGQILGFDVRVQDFREIAEPRPDVDAIISNPPFGRMLGSGDICIDAMESILSFGLPAAVILPADWLEKNIVRIRRIRERIRILEWADLGTPFALTKVNVHRLLIEPA